MSQRSSSEWRLPLELCEYVIEDVEESVDFLAGIVYTRNQQLGSCALVCRSWVPKSRICLFWEVTLQRHNATRFADMVSASKGLGEYVRELITDPHEEHGEWIYNTIKVLHPLLPNLHHLTYTRLPTLQPIFYVYSSRFVKVTRLSLSWESVFMAGMVRVVNSFKNLRSLEIIDCSRDLKLPISFHVKSTCQINTFEMPMNGGLKDEKTYGGILRYLTALPHLEKFAMTVYLPGNALDLDIFLQKHSFTLKDLCLQVLVVGGNVDSTPIAELPTLLSCQNLRTLSLAISPVDSIPDRKISTMTSLLESIPRTIPQSPCRISLDIRSNYGTLFSATNREHWNAIDKALSAKQCPNLCFIEIRYISLSDPYDDRSLPRQFTTEERVFVAPFLQDLSKRGILWCGHLDSHLGEVHLMSDARNLKLGTFGSQRLSMFENRVV